MGDGEISPELQRILRLEERMARLEERTRCLADRNERDDGDDYPPRPVFRVIQGGR
jgi:hypothetical protein